eukprot:CAMPEP_0184685790 /NCGR_PEP_ID=MMETSP0312-20130426/20216_1 /TAXON_ID=31354 /ORGANISM="Compsopogon coeruleus, Strain SAG 36.94" /LENGTH=284 /DNA_ID=CAMNT_0027140249 /DNA_START=121 /DNA_END=975 /DNA_ORIENTATION=-
MVTTGKGWKDLRNGAILQCMEAASLGMPFEVWKTRMGRFRSESTIRAFMMVYRGAGGGMAGVTAFWAGLGPKMVESATKGAVLMSAKESISDMASRAGLSPFASGILAGAGGGVCQVTVMGPCTYLVTATVTGDRSKSVLQIAKETFASRGLRGFYPGGTAIAFRQATNWASRQGFTEKTREVISERRYTTKTAKLTPTEEVLAGVIGGGLSCWNHPFEVARIEMQARANAGQKHLSMLQVFRAVVAESGVRGLFQGIIPRLGLGIWQTLFMVTGAKMLRKYME